MGLFFGNTLEPLPTAKLPFRCDSVIEGSRALAAIAVVYAHLTAPYEMLDPKFAPSSLFWQFEAALPAVLFFFLLSGYVIGITQDRPASLKGTGSYLYRRAVRLLPIYFIAVALGWLTLPGPSKIDLIGNFFLLQNAAADNPTGIALLRGNVNLWSLHYEVVYYIMFIALWWLKPRVWLILIIPFLLGACGVFQSGFPLWLAWLSCGSIFWLLGLYVAWRLPFDESATKAPWPCALVLVLLTWKLEITQSALKLFGFEVAWLPAVIFPYLDSLPVLLWLFILLSRRSFSHLNILELLVWLLPLLTIIWRIRNGSPHFAEPLFFHLCLFIVALVLRVWKPSLHSISILAPLGGMSYGIYALGGPAQHFVWQLFPNFSGTWWTFSVRISLTIALILAAAWILEIWLQPKIRSLIDDICSKVTTGFRSV